MADGGDEHRMYPWGSTDPGGGNQYAIDDCYYSDQARGNFTVVVNVPKVGSTPLGVGRWGQWDLSGSVWKSRIASPAISRTTAATTGAAYGARAP
ncbi:hypothetical protein [Sorangium sp. So ce388]|uniref:hypothetical protein n=1 Tax=Sorangium sp. So ce388 TaxID=3133309 RepID=UPI003F5C1C06